MSGLQNITTLTALASGTLNINVAKTPASLALVTSTIVRVIGTVTLTGNLNISPSGTPLRNTAIKVLWEAPVTITALSGDQIIIFGETVPDELSAKNFIAECVYDGTAWVVNILPDFAGVGIVDSDRLATDSVTTVKIADDAVTLAKMAALTKGNLIVGNASNAPTALDIGVDSKILIGDATSGAGAYVLSGNVTMTKGGVVTLANDAVTTAKILDDNVTAAKLDANSNKSSRDIPLSFMLAAEVGVINITICEACTIDKINVTVLSPAINDTASMVYKNNGSIVLTGSQTDITTGLLLGNIVSTTPSANNLFAANDNFKIEMSKTTKTSCKVLVNLCMTKV